MTAPPGFGILADRTILDGRTEGVSHAHSQNHSTPGSPTLSLVQELYVPLDVLAALFSSDVTKNSSTTSHGASPISNCLEGETFRLDDFKGPSMRGECM